MLRAEVTFQREPGHSNAPLSRRRPSAGDGVSLRNGKGENSLSSASICSRALVLCVIIVAALCFPFISLYA